MTLQNAITQLKTHLPQDSWTQDQDIIAPHLKEWRDRWHGVTPLLLRPKTTEEVVTIVNICRDNRTSLCVQGGNTGLVGGQIPQSELLLSTSKLKAVRNETTESLTVESGMVLDSVHEIAGRQGKRFPLTLASEGSATIGGLCSTNAGGMHVVRYGSMRNLVSGLEIVLADGSVLNTLEPLKKDNTGYALTPLFIGAEGTLGIITAATLKLFPKPKKTETLFVAVASPQHATDLFHTLKGRFPNELSIIELIPALAINWVTQCFTTTLSPFKEKHPWYVLIELESHTDIQAQLEIFIKETLDNGSTLDVIIALSDKQAKTLRDLREMISAAQKHIGGSIKHDVSVPIDSVSTFIKTASDAVLKMIPNCRPLAFGHIGDGNIHFNVMQPVEMSKDSYLENWQSMNRIVHDIVSGLNGSISAEHGIGTLKKAELAERSDPVKFAKMKSIKLTLDPQNILNPRIIF